MRLQKFLLLGTYLVLCLVLSACNQGDHSSAAKNPNNRKIDANRTCVPERELLVANIIGGQVVQPEDADAKKVMMLVSGGQLCTAVAIDKKILLTAAHCIAGNKSNTYASFHSSVSCESGYNKNLHNAGVFKMIVHEGYDSKLSAEKMSSDIALVILEEDIPPGYIIYKIANLNTINDLNELYLYGYGRMASSGGGVGMLRKTTLNHSLYKINVNDRKVEINQTGGHGICQGDSGGPSFVDIEGEAKILGISSYVKGDENDICADEGYQTLAGSYKDWIDYKLAAYGE